MQLSFRPLKSYVLILFAVVLAFSACNKEKATIVPKVQINKKSAEMGTPIEVTYSFSTKKDFVVLGKDMTVFCHFLDPKRNIRFQDDHQPPSGLNTSQWRPGGNYHYTRTVFIPKNIPPGEYKVAMGIYTPGKGNRLTLESEAIGNRYYKVAELLIEIPPQEAVIQFAKGWHDPESEPNDISSQWRWTKKEGVMKVRNPNADALLYFKGDGVPERFTGTEPQKVTVSVGDFVVDTFPITTNQPFMKKYTIKKENLGTEKTLEVKVTVDRTFIPAEDKASPDNRELGLRVYELYLGKAAD